MIDRSVILCIITVAFIFASVAYTFSPMYMKSDSDGFGILAIIFSILTVLSLILK